MTRLVIDIETIGQGWNTLDQTTQAELTKWIEDKPGSPAYKLAVQAVKEELVFSPLTGEIIVIGVLDVDKNVGTVYFQAPQGSSEEFSEEAITYKPRTEKQMLESFWGGAANYDEFITFNGRGFDIPYINARSAVHEVPVRLDLMANRYLNKQWGGPLHVDLYDQFRYYGAVRRAGSLHLWCRALGIPSPKEGGVAAEDVGQLFREKKYADIARYNARDLVATKQVYERWLEFMRPVGK
jgi:3'-5' exonuclease